MIDSRKLKVFLTVAQCESYTAASRVLNTVQSTISHSIHDLEQDLGCVLFQKVGKRMLPTDAAITFIEYGKKIETLMDEAKDSVNGSCYWGKKRFSIGASLSASLVFIPEVLRELTECFPKCTISVVTGTAPEIMEHLRSGSIDIAISLKPENEHQLSFEPVFTDTLSWVISPLMPWKVSPNLKDPDFTGQRFVIFNKGSYTSRMVSSFFRKQKFTPDLITYMGSMETIKAFVKLGQGVALMPAWVAKDEIDSGQLRVLDPGSEDLKRRWGISHRKGSIFGDMEETFWRLCVASIMNKSKEGYAMMPLPMRIDGCPPTINL